MIGVTFSVANLGYEAPIGLHEKVFGSTKSSVGSYLKIGLHFTRHLKIRLHFTELYNSRGCQMRTKVVKTKFIFSISARTERIIKTFLFFNFFYLKRCLLKWVYIYKINETHCLSFLGKEKFIIHYLPRS